MQDSNAHPRQVASAFEAGVAALEAGDHSSAAKWFADLLREDPAHVKAHELAGGIALKTGHLREALRHFDMARRLDPKSAQHACNAAVAHVRLNEPGRARDCLTEALALDGGYLLAHALLAKLDLPGPSYLDLLSAIHAHLRPRTYIEIGVATGLSITLASPQTRAIGIDPSPQIRQALGPNVRIVEKSSDDYFMTGDVHSDLRGLPIDLAFIDGMHRFEFALRDFINIEKRATQNSTVLIHDCFPLTRLTAEREGRTAFWSGDVWRLIVLLRKYRPDLSVNVVATAPTGLGIVRKLDPGSRKLEEHYQEIVEEFLAVDYSVLDSDKAGMLGLFPNDWAKIEELLA
jgi:tetratricopeptide (TPR) repeat protein